MGFRETSLNKHAEEAPPTLLGWSPDLPAKALPATASLDARQIVTGLPEAPEKPQRAHVSK